MDNTFDAYQGESLKRGGQELAADNRADLLDQARGIARSIAANGDGTCNADQVGIAMRQAGMEELGPAAGSLFKGKEWEFTGDRVLSTRVSNHARELKVWRYKHWDFLD